MDNIIVKWGSNEYVVDSNRTIDRYNQLLSEFMNSELLTVDPFSTTEAELDVILETRANNQTGYSWIERTSIFYSRCCLEKVLHIQDAYPWDQLYFQPWRHFPVITMNRFRREGIVLLDNERTSIPIAKKYEVLGCHGDTTHLDYFQQNIGSPFIYCYYFDMIDDYNKTRWCLRFAENSYKREALLLTQYFSIQFLINHPLECFPVPYLKGSNGGILELSVMRTILNPIIEKERSSLTSLLNRLNDSAVSHNLHAETF